MSQRYVLSNAVCTNPGVYCYDRLSLQGARDWLRQGPYTSALGYESTATAMALLLDERIEANRTTVRLNPGDEALVFRLTVRASGGPALKRARDRDFVLKHHEIGLLRRLS